MTVFDEVPVETGVATGSLYVLDPDVSARSSIMRCLRLLNGFWYHS